MDIEIGGGGGGGSSARRRRLSDDGRDAWTGLTLGAVLENNKRPPIVQVNRTLLDIIRDEEPNNSGAYKNLINHHNNKKTWKSFKDRLSLRRAGNAWTSSTMHTPTSDTFSYQDSRSPKQLSRRDSARSRSSANGDLVVDNVPRPQMSRMMSGRVVSESSSSTQTPIVTEPDDPGSVPENETVRVKDMHVSFQNNNNRSSMLRRNSSRLPGYQTQADPFNEPEATPGVRFSVALAAEREQIQRVVSSSMSEPTIEPEPENTVVTDQDEEVSTPAPAPAPPVRMSLMDLLDETDREMGWGAYNEEDEEEYEDEENEAEKVEEEKGKGGGGGEGGKEYNCCVCMVRHKGAAFIPCGHTFCRLCSRELLVARGNCPICNGFILEILDIF